MTPKTLPPIDNAALDAALARLFGARLAHAGRLLDAAALAYAGDDTDGNRDRLLEAAATYRGARSDHALTLSLALATGVHS